MQPSPRQVLTPICLVLFLVAGPAQAQLLQDQPADLEGVDVVEHLGDTLPLDLQFKNERGRTIRLGDYFGKERPVILVLAYYECPMLCSLVLNGMAKGLKGLDWVPGEKFEIVTVSIDPREGPDLARFKKQEYLRELKLPGAENGWHFLTGQEADVRALADAVGFKYRYVEARDEYAHPAVLTLSTPGGVVSRYLYGIKFEPRDLRLGLVEASEGKVGSTLDRFLLYCYHYDATAGRYAPVAKNIMRVGGALTVAVLGVALLVFWARELRRKRKVA
ncbi:hypothetical protein ABI59_11820 [Acidobacteria bacterium Mor1]|nr:hypothetical protein ABI59_11820 [Acidobacteria bacterium Mor1]